MIEHGHPSYSYLHRSLMSTAVAPESSSPVFLHVGCGPKHKDRTPFASQNWREIRLDIDPVEPNVGHHDRYERCG